MRGTITHPLISQPFKPTEGFELCLQFRDKEVLWDCFKVVIEVQEHDTGYHSLINNSITDTGEV